MCHKGFSSWHQGLLQTLLYYQYHMQNQKAYTHQLTLNDTLEWLPELCWMLNPCLHCETDMYVNFLPELLCSCAQLARNAQPCFMKLAYLTTQRLFQTWIPGFNTSFKATLSYAIVFLPEMREGACEPNTLFRLIHIALKYGLTLHVTAMNFAALQMVPVYYS